MKVPALYEMEPIGTNGVLEANGRIYFFCADKDCRESFRQDHPDLEPLGFGMDEDHIEGTMCDRCKKPQNNRPSYVSFPEFSGWACPITKISYTADLCNDCLQALVVTFLEFMKG